jgi:hypothetical protein
MTQTRAIHVIWDFPVMLFKKGLAKIRSYVAGRDHEDARWLNG